MYLKLQNNNVLPKRANSNVTKILCDNQLFLKVFGRKVPDIKIFFSCLIEKEFDLA